MEHNVYRPIFLIHSWSAEEKMPLSVTGHNLFGQRQMHLSLSLSHSVFSLSHCLTISSLLPLRRPVAVARTMPDRTQQRKTTETENANARETPPDEPRGRPFRQTNHPCGRLLLSALPNLPSPKTEGSSPGEESRPLLLQTYEMTTAADAWGNL